MKTFKLMILLCFSLVLACNASAQKKAKAEKTKLEQEAFENTKKLIQGNVFDIQIDRVYPISGVDVSRFNPRGFITIQDSIVKGKLPFFGRAYNIPYGDGGGIEFNNVKEDLTIKTIEKRKKKLILYNFTVRGKDDTYQVNLQVSSSNNCIINIISNHRAQISYSGTISPIVKKE